MTQKELESQVGREPYVSSGPVWVSIGSPAAAAVAEGQARRPSPWCR